MPELPDSKLHQSKDPPQWKPAKLAYAELDVTSNFSFLRGGSHPDELVFQSAELGHRAIAITDINSLAGIVRAYEASLKSKIPLITGARLVFTDAPDVLVWVENLEGYHNLCRLLTLGKRRTEKGKCDLQLKDFLQSTSGLLAAIAPNDINAQQLWSPLQQLKLALPDRLWLSVHCDYTGYDQRKLDQFCELAERMSIPIVATNRIYYHDPGRRPVQDILTCIREKCTIESAGYHLLSNGERYLKSAEQMHQLFKDCPSAIEQTMVIANRCQFRMGDMKHEYPQEFTPFGLTQIQYLSNLAWEGARKRYGNEIPEKVQAMLRHELELIGQLNCAAFFLTVQDIVAFAESKGILCQGRGSAANSAVCYCIGVTAVEPQLIGALFERFLSAERDEPPDIDVDFEHERREEVIQYIYDKYGRDRVGMTAEVISYRGRSAVRDVGKALGLSLDAVDQIAAQLDWWHRGVVSDEQLRGLGLDPTDRTIKLLIAISTELLGFPRHLSQHVGGFAISQHKLSELVPIENATMKDRTMIEWDKDDLDAVNIPKVDVLGLGMLTAISKALSLINQGRTSTGSFAPPKIDLFTIPREDPEVYRMIQNADTIGVFQIESRAQMTMLPRLKPEKFYDLVIEVAIVRPGPIQGKMVHPYLRRRNGEEKEEYPNEKLREVLSKTKGVPLFQEQAMQLAIVGAGFTPGEADKLRKAMAAWKRQGGLGQFEDKFISGMLKNGYTREFADRCFEQIRGFGEYGFPESHAASFALLVYASAWIKRYHPAAFACALVNSQPMGFYAPAQLVRDAQNHGVTVLPIDVNFSEWDCTLEYASLSLRERAGVRADETNNAFSRINVDPSVGPHPNPLAEGERTRATLLGKWDPKDPPQNWGRNGPSLRLGLRRVKGLSESDARLIVEARNKVGQFHSVEQFQQLTGLSKSEIARLAQADAFGSIPQSRRQATWNALKLSDDDAPLFSFDREGAREPKVDLPTMPIGQEVLTDYSVSGLSLKQHPVSLIRAELKKRNIITAAELNQLEKGWIKVCGLVLIRQRPGTASGIVFITIEDETGVANLIVRPDLFDKYRKAARYATLLQCDGYVERQGQVIHVMAKRMEDLSDMLQHHSFRSRDFH